MARKVRNKELDTREARLKLKARGQAYWHAVERGVHVGYRRIKGTSGTFWVRFYTGGQQYEVKGLGNADDLNDADGSAVLDWWQAVAKARALMQERGNDGQGGSYTIKQAMETYFAYHEGRGRDTYDAKRRSDALIIPKLGDVDLEPNGAPLRQFEANLTEQLEKWLMKLADTPPRLRTAKGKRQKHQERDNSEEGKRRRRVSANRTLNILRAGLNHAWKSGARPTQRRLETGQAV